MSGGAGTTWLGLLEGKQSQLNDLGCEKASTVNSEAAFRTHFEGICRKYKEKHPTRLLANLLRSYGNIIAFAGAAGGAAQHASPDALAALVWGASFATIECGCKTGVKLDRLVKLLAEELNSAVPKFDEKVARFPDDQTVQSPLQDLFGEYIDSHLFIISYFIKSPPTSGFSPIKKHIEETTKKFEAARSSFEEMLDLAEKREAEERLQALQPSPDLLLLNGIDPSPKHPYDTQARFGFRRRLGGGSFGEVDEVQEMSTGAVYARKLLHIPPGTPATDFEADVLNEVTIMQKLRHQHIASVLFYVKEPAQYSILMLPVADSDLLAYLHRCTDKGYPVSVVKRIYPWFGCLLSALAYAHALNIKHRDIKPSNILIKDGQPFLADFGIAKDFTMQGMSATRDYFVQGTPVYRAPETKPEHPRGRRADIFALGCVFAEMLTVSKGRSLDAFRKWRVAPENTSGVYAFRANLGKVTEWLERLERDALSDLLVDQISSMLHEDPEERPTAQESLNFLKREQALFCSSH